MIVAMKHKLILIVLLLLIVIVGGFLVLNKSNAVTYERVSLEPFIEKVTEPLWPDELDIEEYNRRVLALSGYNADDFIASTTTTTSTSTPRQIFSDVFNTTVSGDLWPPAQPYPHGGAILPFHRIIAYYGNFYSKNMGILGEYEPDEVIRRLFEEVAAWEAADPDTPVMPAIHYITMVAQGDAGDAGMYRNLMPEEHMQKAHEMAQEIDGILFLDFQVGLSSLQAELPQYREWFTKPDVHLAVDPEFAMHNGTPPGKTIGRFEASDINYAIEWLSDIVREHKLPPKVLIVHRFTDNMVGDVSQITPTPEVQVVLHMDGWGSRQLKRNTYYHVIETDPLQFAGLKIFYKNDLKEPSTGLFTPEQALELHPKPIYIQYQ